MTRNEPNWFALACGIAYILCFLFLSFYRILLIPLNGLMLLNLSPILSLLLVMGILMSVASVLIDPKISMLVGTVAFVLTLVFMLLGNVLVVESVAASLLNGGMGVGASSLVSVQPGAGAILCLACAALHVGVEYLQQRPKQKKTYESNTDFYE